jgi:hypothetical protein
MPINEGLGNPSNLTEKEQREAMKAVYGLAERAPMTPTTTDLSTFSFEERKRLRELLDREDGKLAGQREFDLNKPPAPPYQYREFPFLMYHHATGKTHPARNEEEREHLISEGWSRNPKRDEPIIELTAEPERDEQGLTAADRAEIEAVEKQLKKKK